MMKSGLKKQDGAALVVGLIMLLVMTLIGVTSMNQTRTELKIANNIKNHSDAFQTAALMFERALVDPGIDWILASKVALRGAYAGGYQSANAKKIGTLSVVFVGCRNVDGSSLTRSFKSLVHDVAVTGSELSAAGGNVIGVSRQRAGFTTVAAGCQY